MAITLSNVTFKCTRGLVGTSGLKDLEAYLAEDPWSASERISDLILSAVRKAYERCGLPAPSKVSFVGLAEHGVIDEETAVYLTASYLAIEGALESLEEALEEGDEREARKILQFIASRAYEILQALLGYVSDYATSEADGCYYTSYVQIPRSTYLAFH